MSERAFQNIFFLLLFRSPHHGVLSASALWLLAPFALELDALRSVHLKIITFASVAPVATTFSGGQEDILANPFIIALVNDRYLKPYSGTVLIVYVLAA